MQFLFLYDSQNIGAILAYATFLNISENLQEDESPKQGLFQKKRPFLNPEFEREDQRSGI